MCTRQWYRLRRDAHQIMLWQWRRGDWRFGHTVWCGEHQAWHLAKGIMR